MKQAAAALQDARELVVEILGVQFPGDTETRRVMQQRIEAAPRIFEDPLRDVAQREGHGAGVLAGPRAVGRPGIETAQPQHVAALLVTVQLRRLAAQAPGGEIAQPAAGIENPLAARPDEPDLVLRIGVGRDPRGGQHLDAIDLEGRCPPGRRHELDVGVGEARGRLQARSRPVVDRAFPANFQIGMAAAVPAPVTGPGRARRAGALQIQRALHGGGGAVARRQQRGVYRRSQKWRRRLIHRRTMRIVPSLLCVIYCAPAAQRPSLGLAAVHKQYRSLISGGLSWMPLTGCGSPYAPACSLWSTDFSRWLRSCGSTRAMRGCRKSPRRSRPAPRPTSTANTRPSRWSARRCSWCCGGRWARRRRAASRGAPCFWGWPATSA